MCKTQIKRTCNQASFEALAIFVKLANFNVLLHDKTSTKELMFCSTKKKQNHSASKKDKNH